MKKRRENRTNQAENISGGDGRIWYERLCRSIAEQYLQRWDSQRFALSQF